MMQLRIAQMLRAQRRHISFHTPGHKRAGWDITELSYSDDLSDPTGVLLAAQQDAAAILGADVSLFLTDGSTCGVYAMLFALKKRGCGRVCVPTYAHKSVFHACEALGLEPVLLAQETVCGIPRQPRAEEMEKGLAAADALLLTSPDYYGFFAPLPEAKALCAAAGKPLLVDGAHGAHLHGTPFYAGAFADLWVDGVHKSLPALTQGAVLSANAAWAQAAREGADFFRTSSPSYPILASVEYAVKYPENARIERLSAAAKRALGALANDDWTKIVLPFGEYASAAQAYFEAHGVYPEFNDGQYLMFYLSPATKARELKKLVRLARRLPRGKVLPQGVTSGMVGGNTVEVPLMQAVGRVCARACGIVPPCIPLIAAGEVVTRQKAERLARARHTFGLHGGNITVYGE